MQLRRGINPQMYAELIETLWNVNSIVSVDANGNITELIETLWNVNEETIAFGDNLNEN